MIYSFETSNDVSLIAPSGKLLNIVEISASYNDDVTILYGQLLATFGEPAYMTQNLEDAYGYVIIARDEAGNEHVLNVYEGPSGPAIGGEESALVAAHELVSRIRKAHPNDFEYEGYYLDGPSKVHRGIKNGKAFFSEIELTDDEYEQAYKKLYPNG